MRLKAGETCTEGAAGCASFKVLHVELHGPQTVEFVDAEAVGHAGALRQRVQRAEAHRLEAAAVLAQAQLQMPLADHALAVDGECIAEQRLRKGLAPDLRLEQARRVERAVRGLERAVGLDGAAARL